MNRFEAILEQPVGIDGHFLLSDLVRATAILPNSTVIWLKHGTKTGVARSYGKQTSYGDGFVLSTNSSSAGGWWLSTVRDRRGLPILILSSLRTILQHQRDCLIHILPIECPGRGSFRATRLEHTKYGKLVIS